MRNGKVGACVRAGCWDLWGCSILDTVRLCLGRGGGDSEFHCVPIGAMCTKTDSFKV